LSKKSAKVPYDNALQIWSLQNDLLLDYGVDVVTRSFSLKSYIDDKSFNELDAKLSMLEKDGDLKKPAPITIKLNNGGGEIYAAWGMVSRIKASPCPIYIEAHGHIMSAATMIFAAGKKRRASKYCTFMFHESQIGIDGKLSDVKNYTRHLDQEENMYSQFLADHSKKSLKFWKSVLGTRKDVYLTAKEVADFGLIEEVF
jgi:ATP-dependent protease ClpP protease subunit